METTRDVSGKVLAGTAYRNFQIILNTMTIAIRIIGLLIALAVLSSYKLFVFGVGLLSNADSPIMALQGVIEIVWLLCGLSAAILLLFVRQAGKWVLLAFFALGLVSTWILWVPFAWGIVEIVESGVTKFAIIQGINLCFVICTFILFAQIKRQSSRR